MLSALVLGPGLNGLRDYRWITLLLGQSCTDVCRLKKPYHRYNNAHWYANAWHEVGFKEKILIQAKKILKWMSPYHKNICIHSLKILSLGYCTPLRQAC